uniref:PIR Superfamily Protein n=1 Tax=Parastrongyloides trichosuri TaxID=131310 RepID=A0A0N4ZB46_PARTI
MDIALPLLSICVKIKDAILEDDYATALNSYNDLLCELDDFYEEFDKDGDEECCEKLDSIRQLVVHGRHGVSCGLIYRFKDTGKMKIFSNLNFNSWPRNKNKKKSNDIAEYKRIGNYNEKNWKPPQPKCDFEQFYDCLKRLDSDPIDNYLCINPLITINRKDKDIPSIVDKTIHRIVMEIIDDHENEMEDHYELYGLVSTEIKTITISPSDINVEMNDSGYACKHRRLVAYSGR